MGAPPAKAAANTLELLLLRETHSQRVGQLDTKGSGTVDFARDSWCKSLPPPPLVPVLNGAERKTKETQTPHELSIAVKVWWMPADVISRC